MTERCNIMTPQMKPGLDKPTLARTKPIWVSPREASLLIAIGRTRLYELLGDGTLKSIKIGRKRLISYASLELLGEAQREETWLANPAPTVELIGAPAPITM
jgi:excisionase family DNA binding protein